MTFLLALMTACSDGPPTDSGVDDTDNQVDEGGDDTGEANQAPPAPVLSWSNAMAVGGADDVVCQVDEAASADPDGDALTYSFRWQLEGADATPATGQTTHSGDTLLASETAPGQTWSCLATSNDEVLDSPEASISITLETPTCSATDPLTVCQGVNEDADLTKGLAIGGVWFGFQMTAEGDQTLQGVEMYTAGGADSTLEIWSHDAGLGTPSEHLTGASYTVSGTAGFQGVQFDQAVELSDGDIYWIVWHPATKQAPPFTADSGAQTVPMSTTKDGGATWTTSSASTPILRVSCCE